MNLFGLTITRRKKAADHIWHIPEQWRSGWFGLSGGDVFPGAWQRNIPINRESVVRYGTVWSCITLIASDIAKLWLELVSKDENGVETPIQNAAYSPVLRKPNHYQTIVKFVESWQLSRLVHGNTYVLKGRDNRNVVTDLYVLDAARVQVLVSDSGDVFYKLSADNLAGIEDVTVPASEIIHDICVPMWHPLCGVSPLTASGLAALQGLSIQHSSSELFDKGAQLGGVLTAPTHIPDDLARRIQQDFQDNFMGPRNVGKIPVLGDGMTFQPMTMTAVDAQLVDQLKWTDVQICATFHVPGYMVGIGAAPPYTDIQSLNLQYYLQALQNPVENMEYLLEEGLEVKPQYGIRFNLESLIRMDSKTQMDTATAGVSGGIFTPNEARAQFNKKPVTGGDTPYLQEQNWALSDLAKRHAAEMSPKPAESLAPAPAPASAERALDLNAWAAAAETVARKELAA